MSIRSRSGLSVYEVNSYPIALRENHVIECLLFHDDYRDEVAHDSE
jgi:hypothetical protein